MKKQMRAGFGVLALVVASAATTTVTTAVASTPAGATPVAMGSLSGGVVSPIPGTSRLDFPDPTVTYSGVGNTYYAYATGTTNRWTPKLQVPQQWKVGGGTTTTGVGTPPGVNGGIGFTTLSCTTHGCTDTGHRTMAMAPTIVPRSLDIRYGLQAPSVADINGQWVMYYAGNYETKGAYAVYYSVSSTGTGGFHATPAETPLMYQAGTGWSTDPSVFVSPIGQPWLLWKSGTYPGSPRAHLWSMRLSTNGTAMLPGATSYVLANQPTSGWAATTIENPQMVWSGET